LSRPKRYELIEDALKPRGFDGYGEEWHCSAMEEKPTILNYHGPEPVPEGQLPESTWLGIFALGFIALVFFLLVGFGLAFFVWLMIGIDG
jgi:hypothetical protein